MGHCVHIQFIADRGASKQLQRFRAGDQSGRHQQPEHGAMQLSVTYGQMQARFSEPLAAMPYCSAAVESQQDVAKTHLALFRRSARAAQHEWHFCVSSDFRKTL
jgi:hypothetical protein